jgi:hypothetical protein
MAILPKVKLRALPSFPANVFNGPGIDVEKQSGNYTITLNVSNFQIGNVSPALAPTVYAVSWGNVTTNNPSGEFSLVPFASLQSSSSDLSSLAGLESYGLVARVADADYVTTTITGTASEVTVTNGDGVAGAPTISLPNAMTFTGKTVTGGTYSSPTITTPTGIVKGDIGLGNVDNTSDANKPVSTATQTALDLKANTSGLGTAAAANVTDFATAAQGAKADSAVQPGALGALATKDKISVSDVNATGTPDASTYYRGDGTWTTPPASSGDVTGPAGSVNARIATFNGTTGKVIQDSGKLLSDLANIAGGNTFTGTQTMPKVAVNQASTTSAQFDSSSHTGYSVANGASASITPNLAGADTNLLLIGETQLTGKAALFICAGGSAPIMVGGATAYEVGSSPTAFGVAWDAGSNTYKVYNNAGGTATFRVMLFRIG